MSTNVDDRLHLLTFIKSKTAQWVVFDLKLIRIALISNLDAERGEVEHCDQNVQVVLCGSKRKLQQSYAPNLN